MATATKLSNTLNAAEDHTTTLLWALEQGDRHAFWPLWQQHEAYLYRCCLRWMEFRRADADEALSQSMLRAWDKLPHYATKIHNLRAWLSRLVYRVCLDFYRDRSRVAYSLDETSEQQWSPYDQIAADQQTPITSLQRHELAQVISHFIAKLPDNLRDPFQLRFCENWSYAQLAHHFELTEPTVRKRIQQARAILRRHISRYLSGHPQSGGRPPWEQFHTA